MTSNKAMTQFRIMVGSYEHNLLCLSLIMKGTAEAVFTPIFHFQAHTLSIKSIDIAKRYLVTGSNDEHIRIYDLQKRKELGTLLSHQGTVTTLKFSKETTETDDPLKSGKWLLSGSEDGKIIIWRTKDWETFGTLKGHQGRVNDLDIHPSGRVAISVGSDHTVRLWNLMTAKKAAILKIKGRDHLGQPGEIVKWISGGKHFVVGLLNQLFIYELSEEALIVKKIQFKPTLMCIETVTLGDKEYLVVGLNNGSIEFYEVSKALSDEKPEPGFTLRGHSNRIKGLSFICSPSDTNDVPYLVSVSSDGKIVVWDLSESKRDQVAVYDSGERLNCVAVCGESIEKADTMKRRHDEVETNDPPSESEYETDGEELRKVMLATRTVKKKSKKNKKNKDKVSVTLE
ncbi:WD40 repeat-like protein [Metschnikowia bicuspidata var. bicuspidata NRRL YB-4993]|uniref:WD40 repeat-like protein n=1 Tax=Metschnikowia bicuspidata var. bicuspidata NRRL YB-4993 TaxID=869754 RepID=A0A1A0HHR4_9ASCO|nr:WD40 repeat-like protein [Metschnikowia bicuspidata var. bicuspidata NRRL YB-4993]OBA23422.1 WD40 repeat-like protein [Metschnikowia bicuspidata var. bicuspidata NRRL YB-4993]